MPDLVTERWCFTTAREVVFHHSMYIYAKVTGSAISEENTASYQKLTTSQCLLEGLCNLNWEDFKHREDLHLLLWHAAMESKDVSSCRNA